MTEASPDEPAPASPSPTNPKEKINRRSLFRKTLLGGAMLGLGGFALQQSSGYALDPARLAALKVLGMKEAVVLDAVAARMLRGDDGEAPSPASLDTTGWIDGWLSRQPAWIQRDIRQLLGALEHSPPFLDRIFSRFSKASGEQQDAILEAWASSGISLRQQGFTALKGLCVMAYYRSPETWPLIGYDGPLIKSQSPK